MDRLQQRLEVVRPQPGEVPLVLPVDPMTRVQLIVVGEHVGVVRPTQQPSRGLRSHTSSPVMPVSAPDGKRPSVCRWFRVSEPLGPPTVIASWKRYQAPAISFSPMTSCSSLSPRMNSYASWISSRVVSTGSWIAPSGSSLGMIV